MGVIKERSWLLFGLKHGELWKKDIQVHNTSSLGCSVSYWRILFIVIQNDLGYWLNLEHMPSFTAWRSEKN